MKKHKKWLLALSLLALFFLVACGEDEAPAPEAEAPAEVNGDADDAADLPADAPEGADELVAALAVELVTFDIHRTNDMGSAQVNRQIFETLVKQDADMNIIPGLAHSWHLYQPNIYEFQLLEGVYFHNGQPLTAYDVANTLLRAAASPHVAAIVGVLDADTIEVVDELTVRVGTEAPFAPFLSHLAHVSASIMYTGDWPEDLSDEDFENRLAANPVGTGPFKLVDASDWLRGDRVNLVRFEDWHNGIPSRNVPEFSSLVIRFIGEAASRLIALETGEIHIDLLPQTDDFARIEGEDGIALISIDGLRTEYLGMNNTNPILAIPEVRHAINYAVDVEAIVRYIYGGHGVAGSTFISANVFGYNPNIEPFGVNIERAQQLLEEAGFADGFDITLTANTERQDRIAIAQIVAQDLSRVGINVTIQQFQWAEMLDMLHEGEVEGLFLLGWTTVTGDADYGLFPLLHSSYFGPAGNHSRFSNAEVDRLLEAGRLATDPQERLEIYHEVQEVLREYTPWVVMLQEMVNAAYAYEVIENFNLDPVGTHFLGNVRFR